MLRSASQAAELGQTVAADVGHVSKRGEGEVRKVKRLDEGDFFGGELAVRAEFLQRGLEDSLAEFTCRIAPGLGETRNGNRNRRSLRTLETGARLSLKTCLRGRHGTPRRARRQAWGWACASSSRIGLSRNSRSRCFFAFLGFPLFFVLFQNRGCFVCVCEKNAPAAGRLCTALRRAGEDSVSSIAVELLCWHFPCGSGK